MVQNSRELDVEKIRCSISGRVIRTARAADEWYVDIDDPEAIVSTLRARNVGVDLFTFWQRPPHVEARFAYHIEQDSIAVLPVTTYEDWLRRQINNKTRNLIAKAAKNGIVLRPAEFDDVFIEGMVRIFNETPVRQGMPFWHFGKGFETIKREFSRYLFREELFGAYLGDELVGFIFLAHTNGFSALGQILSMMKHRDKAINNALIAKAVEVCARRQVPMLAYAVWPRGPLRDFKRHNGFQRMDLPRYYVPLTARGSYAMKLGLHKSQVDRLPDSAYMFLRELRTRFYSWRPGGLRATGRP